MDRRDFLKLGGLFSAALVLQFHSINALRIQPLEVEVNGTLYRGTFDGKILFSKDTGKTWQLHTNFGTDISITGLSSYGFGQLCAQLEFAGYPFNLILAQNGKAWKTV